MPSRVRAEMNQPASLAPAWRAAMGSEFGDIARSELKSGSYV